MSDVSPVYAETVWNAFLERTGGARLMGPVEFSLVRYWWLEGVPLRSVLAAIRETPKAGRTLLYWEEPVAQAARRSAGGM